MSEDTRIDPWLKMTPQPQFLSIYNDTATLVLEKETKG